MDWDWKNRPVSNSGIGAMKFLTDNEVVAYRRSLHCQSTAERSTRRLWPPVRSEISPSTPNPDALTDRAVRITARRSAFGVPAITTAAAMPHPITSLPITITIISIISNEVGVDTARRGSIVRLDGVEAGFRLSSPERQVYTGWPKKVSHYQIIKKSY